MGQEILATFKFWELIEQSKRKGSVSEQKLFLKSFLATEGSYFILLFIVSLRQKIKGLYIKETCEIIKLIKEIVSEEMFLDFCCYIILNGQDVYEKFVLEPDSITDSLAGKKYPFSFYTYNILDLSDIAYEEYLNPSEEQERKLLIPGMVGQVFVPFEEPPFGEPNFSDEYLSYLKGKYKRLASLLEKKRSKKQ